LIVIIFIKKIMIRYVLVFSLFLSFNTSSAQDPVFDNLVWSDEFNSNGAIDGENWFHQTELPNGSSWYNNEIQHYTNREDNSYVANGSLFINAKKENFTDQGVVKSHTSARLNSKFAFTYGRVQIRAVLPTGVGTWPALWTLGKNIIEPGGYWNNTHGTVGWPACGEIDIMEHWGNNQDYVQSALHTPSSFGNTMNKGGRAVPGASDNFHIYEMEWNSEKITFRIDGIQHYVYQPAVKNAETWPFDADQYLLLNVAILPEIAASFTESAMQIDYVRVYQEAILGVDEVSVKEQIKAYPNPVGDTLTITIPSNLVGAEMRLYAILGQEIAKERLLDTSSKIDFSSVPNGLYLLKIETSSGTFTQSIVK
jgi:beta-glucanase (GH16 family)